MNKIKLDGQDFTEDCDGIEFVSDLTFALNGETKTVEVATASSFTFYGEAFTYLQSLFYADGANHCEAVVDVEIILSCCETDTLNFVIRYDSIAEYCPGSCYIEADLASLTDNQTGYECLQSKIFWKEETFLDNVQTARVGYCNSFSIINLLFLSIYFAMFPILLILEAIEFLFDLDIPSLDDVAEQVHGCGRYHPSPYLASIFELDCARCNLTFKSSILKSTVYKDTVLLQAQYEEGFRHSTQKNWIPENGANLNSVQLLEQVKDVWNADYRITRNNELVFERKDYFGQNAVVLFDADEYYENGLMQEPVCYEFLTGTNHAYGRYSYEPDALDETGNKMTGEYNDIIEFNVPVSKCRKGELSRSMRFSVANFMRSVKSSALLDSFRETGIPGGGSYYNQMLLKSGVSANFKLLVIDPASKSKNIQTVIKKRNAVQDDRYDWNYPFYLKEGQADGLYEPYHAIDDPRNGLADKHKISDITIPYSCEMFAAIQANYPDVSITTALGATIPGKIKVDFEKDTITFSEMTT